MQMRVDRERLEAMILPELIDSAKDLQSVFHAIEVVEVCGRELTRLKSPLRIILYMYIYRWCGFLQELIDELYDATKRASDRLQELQNVENSRRPKGFSKMFRSFKIKKNVRRSNCLLFCAHQLLDIFYYSALIFNLSKCLTGTPSRPR